MCNPPEGSYILFCKSIKMTLISVKSYSRFVVFYINTFILLYSIEGDCYSPLAPVLNPPLMHY